MKQAFLVLGCESTFTRGFTRALISAGCAGDGDHGQRWDGGLADAPDRIAWRRSMPYGANTWPDLDAMLATLRAASFDDVRVFWMFRDRHPTIKSQVANGYVKSEEESWKNIERGQYLIGKFVFKHELPVQIVRYERIVRDPERIRFHLGKWGLSIDTLPAIVDGNAKYRDLAPVLPPPFPNRYAVPGAGVAKP